MAGYPSIFPSSLKTSLTSYWSLDTNGSDYYNVNNGTINGTTTSTGKISGCQYFNGSSAYISLADGSKMASGTFTATSWIYPTAGSKYQDIIANWNQTGYGGWNLRLTNGNTLQLLYGNGVGSFSTIGTSATISLNTWTHVAITYDGSTVTLYINGAASISATVGFAIAYNATYRPVIGANLYQGGTIYEYFTGYIDDVGYWSRTLSSTEIATVYSFNRDLQPISGNVIKGETNTSATAMISLGLLGSASTEVSSATVSNADLTVQTLFKGSSSAAATVSNANLLTQKQFAGNSAATSTAAADTIVMLQQGLISYYNFDSNVFDSFGARNGTAVGSVAYSTDKKNGSNSLSLNGSSYVSLQNKTTLQLSTFTLAGWIKTTNNGNYTDIFQYWNQTNGTYNGFDLRKNSSNKLEMVLGYGASTSPFIAGTTSLNTGNWIHIAATYDGSTVKLYVNGTLERTLSVSTISYSTSLCNAAIGATVGAGAATFYWNGQIDEFGVWNRVLSASEVNLLLTYFYEGNKIGTGSVQASSIVQSAEMTSYSTFDASGTGTNSSIVSANLSVTARFVGSVTSAATVSASSLTVPKPLNASINGTSTARATSLFTKSKYPDLWSGALKTSLVSYWGLDGDATDSYGINHGTAVGGVTYTGSMYGVAEASFNGTSGYITLPNASAFRPLSFTWSGWVTPTVLGNGQNQVLYSNEYYVNSPASEFGHFIMLFPGGSIGFYSTDSGSNQSGVTTSNLFSVGQKKHLSVTYDSGSTTSKIYVDGVVKATYTSHPAAYFTASSIPMIGARALNGSPTQYANAKIDEVGFWNAALSAVDVQTLYVNYVNTVLIGSVNSSALVGSSEMINYTLLVGAAAPNASVSTSSADLRLDVRFAGSVSSSTSVSANLSVQTLFAGSVSGSSSISGRTFSKSKYVDYFNSSLKTSLVSYWGLDGDLIDSYGASHGTPSVNTNYTSSVYGGYQGKFSNNQEYITINNKTPFLTSTFTWAAWIKIPNGGNNYYSFLENSYYFNSTTRIGYGYQVLTYNKLGTYDLLILGYQGTTGSSTAGINNLTSNIPTHLVLTYDKTNLKIYTNGSLQGTFPMLAPAFLSNTGSVYLGKNSNNNNDYIGSMDEVGFWNTALSATDVSNLYTTYLTTFLNGSTGTNTSLVSGQLIDAVLFDGACESTSLAQAELTVKSFIYADPIETNTSCSADLTTSINMLADVVSMTEVDDAELITRYFVEADTINSFSTSEASLQTQILLSGEAISYGEISSPDLQSVESLKIDDLVTETELIAYKLAKFVRGFNVNAQKATNLANATQISEATTYGQLTNISSSLKNYIDIADAELLSVLQNTSGSIKDYVDQSDLLLDAAITNLSSSLITYIDIADSVINLTTIELSSNLKSYIDTSSQSLSQNIDSVSSSLKNYIDLQDTALQNSIVYVSSSLLNYTNNKMSVLSSSIVNLSGALNISLNEESIKRISDDEYFVKLDGSRILSGNLDMGNNNIVNANSATFAGDLIIQNGLQVNGDYMRVKKLNVSDKLITISKNAIDGNVADGSGLFVDGANISFTYDNQSGKWSSNIGLGTVSEAGFGAAIKLSGSTFTNITTIVTNNKFDLGNAIHDLDAALQQQATRISNTYDSVRLIVVGQIIDGQGAINLTQVGGAQFSTSEIDSISLDVLISEDGTSYTDNFVSSKMYIEQNSIKIIISSPAVFSGSYRLIAINQKQRILLP